MKCYISFNGGIRKSGDSFYLHSKNIEIIKYISCSVDEIVLLGFYFILEGENTLHDCLIPKDKVNFKSLRPYNSHRWTHSMRTLSSLFFFSLKFNPKESICFFVLPSSYNFALIFLSKIKGLRVIIFIRGAVRWNICNVILIRNVNKIITVSKSLMPTGNNLNEYILRPLISSLYSDHKYSFNLQRINCDNLSGKAYRALYVGRIEKAKGIDELIKAVDHLRGKIEFELIFCGPLVDYSVLDLTNSGIQYKGKLGDMDLKIEYENSDVFIFPSHSEGFPRVLYEAAMCKLPIVTSRLPGIESFFSSSEVIFFEPKNVSSLIAGLGCFHECYLNKTLQTDAAFTRVSDYLNSDLFDLSQLRSFVVS
jgi:glycosyltransferase involved in cell wall biosynthesis